MIEIIEKGPEKFFVTCQKCGTKLSYELDDVREYFGGSGKIYCPVCHNVCYHFIPKETNEHTDNIIKHLNENIIKTATNIDYTNDIVFNG